MTSNIKKQNAVRHTSNDQKSTKPQFPKSKKNGKLEIIKINSSFVDVAVEIDESFLRYILDKVVDVIIALLLIYFCS